MSLVLSAEFEMCLPPDFSRGVSFYSVDHLGA
jgi:hypothetical protein